ncbi:hypothetical protein Tco_1238832 [Tanacetum coccineum]
MPPPSYSVSMGDVLNYAFIASRLQSAALQTKLLRHADIVDSGSTFDDALCMFNTSMDIDFLSNPSEMALWQSEREDHTSDWLRVVPISGLGQTMNACSKVFTGDFYGDHAVSCAGIIGIKHRHNAVRDTLVDICFRSGISAGKEVDIGLGGGSSPLTQTGMADFVPDRVVIDAAQRKRGKYMAKCAAIGYGFLPLSFSSLGELEADTITLLKRIRKFYMTQDIGACATIHIFKRISFAIAKGVGAQIVSRLPSNLL